MKTNTIFPKQRLNGFVNFNFIKTGVMDVVVPVRDDFYTFSWPLNVPKEIVNHKTFKSNDEEKIKTAIASTKKSETKYENFDDVKIGDIVKFKSMYGDNITGIVTGKKGKKNVLFKSYTSAGNPIEWDEQYTDILKINY